MQRKDMTSVHSPQHQHRSWDISVEVRLLDIAISSMKTILVCNGMKAPVMESGMRYPSAGKSLSGAFRAARPLGRSLCDIAQALRRGLPAPYYRPGNLC